MNGMLIGFMIGLSSAFHCLGMCGPIAMALPVNRSSNLSIASGALQYNAGRIFSYSVLGIFFGSIGLSLSGLKWMQWLSIFAGILMIFVAWHKVVSPRRSKLANKLFQLISSGIGKLVRSKSPFKLFGLGILNGLLPCGMIFIGLTNALVQATPLQGGLAMVFFGLGTLPMMFLVVFFASKISANWRLKFSKTVPYLMTIIGILVILRGMNLGIPYISPEIKITKAETNLELIEKPKVEMICCTPSSVDREACLVNDNE